MATVRVVDIVLPRRDLRRATKVLGDTKRIIKRAARTFARVGIPRLRTFIRRAYRTQGRSQGRGWKKLSPEYARRKRARYGRKKIGQRTGRTRASLVSRQHPDQIVRVTPTEVGFGSKVDYFKYVQRTRPPINPTRRERRELRDIMVKELDRQLDRAIIRRRR